MAEESKAPPMSSEESGTDQYDRAHGDPAKGRDHEPSGLTEANNTPSVEPPTPFKNLKA